MNKLNSGNSVSLEIWESSDSRPHEDAQENHAPRTHSAPFTSQRKKWISSLGPVTLLSFCLFTSGFISFGGLSLGSVAQACPCGQDKDGSKDGKKEACKKSDQSKCEHGKVGKCEKCSKKECNHSTKSCSGDDANGSENSSEAAKEHSALPSTSVKDLAQCISDSNSKTVATVVYDANNEATRKKYGTIPGAVLLASYKDFPVQGEQSVLPSDRKTRLVFYCANEQCMASHTAANRAIDAGYSNVSVLSAGIMGWSRSGQKTATIQ